MATEQQSVSNVSVDNTERIWKSLRLVPEFDGNSNVLIRFLNICDQLILTYANPAPGNELNNFALINGILNKITGQAAKTLATNGIPQDWQGIRNALINSFSDHRDESALYTDMSLLTQGSDTPQIFYERVQNLLSVIMTYVELHETIKTTIEAKRELYKKLALQTYTRGLTEPLGSRVRCMRPESLEKALEFAQEELNVLYLQRKAGNPLNSKKPNNNSLFNYLPFNSRDSPVSSRQFNYAIPTQQFRPFNFPSVQQSNFSNNLVPNNTLPNNSFRPTLPPQNFAHQQGPSRTQQAMRALPRSNMSTGFRIPPRANFPTPMSGVSHPPARVLPPTQQNTRPQINMNELCDAETFCHPDLDYYQQVNVTEPENNFQTEEVTETADYYEQSNFSLIPDQTSPE